MSSVIAGLISWPFVIGLAVGFVLERLLKVTRARWLNKHRPLPGGAKRSCSLAIDSRRAAAVIMIATVGWSVFKTQDNADQAARITADARSFAAETRTCQTVLIQAIIDRAKVTADYNAESVKQRDALSDWLRTLLQPPPDIAQLSGDDPVRQQWAVGVTAAYFNVIQRSQQEQAATDATRPQLPDPNCSR